MQRKTLTAILALSLLIFPCTGSLADLREEMAARADRVAGMLVDESPTVRRDGAKKIERDIENNLRDFSTDEESPIYLEELYKALAPLTESDKSTIRLRTARLLEGFTDSIIEMGLVENSTQLLQSIYPVAPDEEIRAKIGEALDERGAKKPDIKSMPLAAVEPPPSQDEKTEMDKPAAKGQSVPEEETAITEVTKAENPPPEPPVKVEPPKTPETLAPTQTPAVKRVSLKDMGIVEEKASAAPTRVTIKSGVAVKVNAPRPTTTRTVSVKTISMKEITKPQSGDGKISSEEGKTPSIVHTPPETASRVGDRVILKMVDTKFDNANENDALSALSLCLELADRIRASDFSPDVELRRLTASIRAHVMALLNEESAIVSAKAAEVAGAIHDETSMPILANLLESPSALVREKAYDALKEISGKTFPPSAKKWQEYIKSEGSTSME